MNLRRRANDDRTESIIKELNQTNRRFDALRLKHNELLEALGVHDGATAGKATPSPKKAGEDGDGDSDDGEGTRQRPRLRDIIDSCFAQSETNE